METVVIIVQNAILALLIMFTIWGAQNKILKKLDCKDTQITELKERVKQLEEDSLPAVFNNLSENSK